MLLAERRKWKNQSGKNLTGCASHFPNGFGCIDRAGIIGKLSDYMFGVIDAPICTPPPPHFLSHFRACGTQNTVEIFLDTHQKSIYINNKDFPSQILNFYIRN